MKKVLVWTGFDFDLMATDVCHILGFYRNKVKLHPDPAPNSAGVNLLPGDTVMKVGGHKTSAGFTVIWFDPGGGLSYRGIHKGLDGTYVCFDQLKNGVRIKAKHQEYKRLYFAWRIMDIEPPCWFHCNHAGSGRIVETTVLELDPTARNDGTRGGNHEHELCKLHQK